MSTFNNLKRAALSVFAYATAFAVAPAVFAQAAAPDTPSEDSLEIDRIEYKIDGPN